MASGGGNQSAASSWLSALLVLAALGACRGCTKNEDCGHGTCQGYSPSTPGTCQCNSGYTGGACGHATGCDSNPCQHGTCTATGGSHSCACAGTGYSGTNCDHATGCDNSPCKNGGKCTANGGSHSCDCDSTDYGGANCDHAISCNTGALPSTPGKVNREITNKGKYPSKATYSGCGKHEKLVGPTAWTCHRDGNYVADHESSSNTLECKGCPGINHCPAEQLDCSGCKSWQVFRDCKSTCSQCT
eukprot:COSAG06_NODE_12020_length_1434_cov_1.881648_1_plen_244_part_10